MNIWDGLLSTSVLVYWITRQVYKFGKFNCFSVKQTVSWKTGLIIMILSQQTFAGVQDVFWTSSGRLQDMSWRCFQYVFSVTIFRLWRRLQDVLKISCKMSWRRLQDVLEDKKLLRWRHLEEMPGRRFEGMSWRRLQGIL